MKPLEAIAARLTCRCCGPRELHPLEAIAAMQAAQEKEARPQ